MQHAHAPLASEILSDNCRNLLLTAVQIGWWQTIVWTCCLAVRECTDSGIDYSCVVSDLSRPCNHRDCGTVRHAEQTKGGLRGSQYLGCMLIPHQRIPHHKMALAWLLIIKVRLADTLELKSFPNQATQQLPHLFMQLASRDLNKATSRILKAGQIAVICKSWQQILKWQMHSMDMVPSLTDAA